MTTTPLIRSGATNNWIAGATALLADGICVWCERAPSTSTSYLCRDCGQVDADGVLARSQPQHRAQAG